MKILSGLELTSYIKERQAREVRALRQADGVFPTLAIIQTIDNPVINKYVALKKAYGADILIDVEPHFVTQNKAMTLIKQLNTDERIHGIIVQLPLEGPSQTQELVNAVAPQKDVDGLGENALFDPATPLSIWWLLAGYNVDLKDKNIVIVGRGRLVGQPLAKLFQDSGYQVAIADRQTEDLALVTRQADILISATGSPGVITSAMVKPGAVVVDAGVATDAGKLVGDVADEVRKRDDVTITPQKGGVGPLTVCALFDNVIRAARLTVGQKKPDHSE